MSLMLLEVHGPVRQRQGFHLWPAPDEIVARVLEPTADPLAVYVAWVEAAYIEKPFWDQPPALRPSARDHLTHLRAFLQAHPFAKWIDRA